MDPYCYQCVFAPDLYVGQCLDPDCPNYWENWQFDDMEDDHLYTWEGEK